MRNHVSTWLAAAGLALAVQATAQTQSTSASNPSANEPGSGKSAFVTEATQRTFTVTGTVVRERSGQMVVRIDDHRHAIPFQLGGSAAAQDVQPGSRVSVTYHPTGSTGQTVESVQVLEPPRNARQRRGSDREQSK